MRYRIDLAYDGADYCGWQIQPEAPSVQGTLEKALSTLLHSSIGVVGAGRTDTGVNASYYVAHFDYDLLIADIADLKYKLNAILPGSISIFRITQVPDEFHARFSAYKREYRYFLNRSKNPFIEKHSYRYGYPSVNFESMNKAAESLIGTHDFSCFEKSGGDNKTSICTVYEAGWTGIRGPLGEEMWMFRISANRFLRNMVRAIVGTLLEVGRGKRSIEDFSSLILPPESKEKGRCKRSKAGESVPGHALFLSDIGYPEY